MGSGGLCWSAWVRAGLHLIRRFLALPSRRWPHPASSSFSGLVLSGGWSRSRSGSAFTLLIGWLLGWSWWSVSHPASRLVMVSSGLVAGSALPGPMALAPRSMLGFAFGAVSSCSVRWWSWLWLVILRCGHRSRVPVPAPSLPAGISRARSAIPSLVWFGVQGMQPGFWLFGLLFLFGCLPISSYQTE